MQQHGLRKFCHSNQNRNDTRLQMSIWSSPKQGDVNYASLLMWNYKPIFEIASIRSRMSTLPNSNNIAAPLLKNYSQWRCLTDPENVGI